MPKTSQCARRAIPVALLLGLCALSSRAVAEPEREPQVSVHADAPGVSVAGTRVRARGAAVVNFAELARQEALRGGARPPVRPLVQPELEEPAEPTALNAPLSPSSSPFVPFAASPPPSASFMGLDDIPMVDSSFIIIPPDVGGAVGQKRILQGLNNNYRILDKSDGSVISTVGTATFWAPTGEPALLGLTDPRTLYDPINDRWIVEMQTVTTGAGDILLGVSQTGDPAGNWFLFRFPVGATIDFPIVGFNRDWVTVTINRYSIGGTFQRGITLVVNYPQLRAGTFSGTLFTQSANSHFCSAPCATYSATSDTLYVVTHLSSTGATYVVDTITGTSTPVYTTGSSQTRPGGGWAQPGGGILPQSAPNAGASACSPPCLIETQDSQIRSAPVYRGGSIFYTQTIGLPSGGLAHTAVQWTKLTTPGGAVVDGGRIEDATATATNGGKWYAYPHIAPNAVGDFIVGYSQFSSAQHPSAGYSVHLAADAAGTIRDPVIYKPGEDYYHKDFGAGRNRWGDFSQAQVDPSDDRSLWVVDEYGKNRIGTDDGATGSNSSRWSTYWANVAGPPPVAVLAPGPTLSEGNVATTPFLFNVNLSTAYSLPVTLNFQTADGTATVADNDYQPAVGSIVIPAGSTSATIQVNVVGDTKCEPNETFSLQLVSATNATIGPPGTATATILTDDAKTITASAGAGGSISPSGSVPVVCDANQSFTITPDPGFHVADVLVDAVSQGAITAYTFTNVTADHAISASFAADVFTIDASAGPNGSISPSGAVVVNGGASQSFAITPATNYHVADVLVDGSSVGAVTAYTFPNVTADHTIAAGFAIDTHTLQVNVVGKGSVARSPDQLTYDHGTSVQLTATPDAGFDFGGWGGDASGATNPLTLLMDGNKAVTATFADTAAPLVHAVAPNGGEILAAGGVFDFEWTAADNDTVTALDLFLSRAGAAGPFETIATGAPNSGLYAWTVTGPGTADALFRIVAHDRAGNAAADSSDAAFTITEATAVGDGPVTALAFDRVRPNPVASAAHLSFGLPREARTELRLVDVRGREVAVLVSGSLPAGWHSIVWDGRTAGGRRAGPGMYFAQLKVEGKTLVRRFALLR